MPGKVKVRVLAGRNLPVMDRANDTTDAFVEIRLGTVTQKTDVCRRSLNPQWNSDWFRFEVQDDAELQDEPLQIRVMDHDTYSAHDAIGKVYLSLSPLLAPELISRADTAPAGSAGGPSVISGWIPIYDTLHGIRGEVNVMVKVDLFSDFNKFRHSSCGVQYFSSPCVPAGHCVQAMLGFVHELVVNDDPEYQWIDKIRTPRASNEARQTLFSKLSGEVQRRIGVNVIEAGGNAVIGYRQCFDLEGETGIVVRGIGTAVSLVRTEARPSSPSPLSRQPGSGRDRDSAASVPAVGAAGAPAAASVGASAGAPVGVPAAHTTSVEGSDSGDKLSRSLENDTNFKAPSSTTSSGADTKLLAQLVTTSAQQRGQQQDNYESAEFPFITLRTFPSGFITHIGGTVSARSVKLLDRIHHPEESETRDAWWAEVRTEVRSHCKSLACNVVLGYEEATTIWDDVCVLSAYGTAATVNFAALGLSEPLAAARCDSREVRSALRLDASLTSQALVILEEPDSSVSNCAPCHLPYSQGSAPASALQFNCAVCRKSKVPDVVFSTIEPPGGLPVTGRGCLVQARVCREKADVKSEVLAKEVSDRLPFLEYELHRQLLTKLRILGMNALFDLTIQLSIGEEIMVAVATATAVYLSALPPPVVPRVTSAVNDSADRLAETQRRITETVASNREAFNISDQDESGRTSDEESEDEEDKPELDLAAGNKDACILEMDDTEDADLLSMLMSRPPPELFDLVSTSSVPGVPERLLLDDRQLFTRIVRTKLSSASNRQLAQTVEKIIQGLYFKLRKLAPCALCGLRFSVDLPEDDEIQISVYGAALSVSAPLSKQASLRSAGAENGSADGTGEGPVGDRSAGRAGSVTGALKTQNSLWRGDYDVIITPLPHVTGGKVERWLGNLNFFFIRECTGLREVGGLNGFMQDLITEVLAVVRAHVTSLGGNALVSYFMSQCVLLPNPHKNQAQCLVNVGGDAVLVGHAARSDDG
ncbi:C2 domain-containing protein 5-like isoform X4 [Amphibalanus amphitrite]|uniref:C2 domain-containing protein 5-like isoform X4 n=1 Tax=Amphibalanus amphitrite TaxID=1232801 RepID=UPI001C926929|nr:C2 domain-containing protein 5-like isoform X4 [Amphibalanus amphitrite]XP_043237816.1 C2 domain-containing protein 5-like isoform X4 [Amphibalanus amphitrite]